MPWYMNVTKDIIRTKKADGSHIGFSPHRRVFVFGHEMSGDIEAHVSSRKLKYIGSGQDIEPLSVDSSTESVVVASNDAVDIDYVFGDHIQLDDESDTLAINDIEGQLETDSEDETAPERGRRRRRKR